MNKIFVLMFALVSLTVNAASPWAEFQSVSTPRMRVIIDNDFSGDPDGLFQLAQHVLSPSVELRGIIGSHLDGKSFQGPRSDTAGSACVKAREVLSLLGADSICPVVKGAPSAMVDQDTPVDSEGARLIIAEALRDDVSTPLYVVCGAGLTNIASALLMSPEIARRLTLIWIGGQEYDGTAPVPPGGTEVEYNLALSVAGARAVFNRSDVSLWQVPRNAYRQCIVPMSQLFLELPRCGAIGRYLLDSLTSIMTRLRQWGTDMGEVYVLGDSPLVLLTALQTGFERDPASSDYIVVKAPFIDGSGRYVDNPSGRPIRVYQRIRTELMNQDLIAKLRLAADHHR